MTFKYLFRFSAPLILLFGLCFLIYKDFFQTFYQQDEWHSLGIMKSSGIDFIFSRASFLDMLTFANRPLARLAGLIFLGTFPFNVTPYAFFSLIFHSINTLLVFYLIKNLNISKTAAVIGSIFFLLNSSGKQAVLWISAGIATLPSTTTILIALLFYFFYLKTSKYKFLILSILSVISSLAFKENALFIFFLIPLLEFFYYFNKYKKIRISKFSFALLLFSAFIFAFKFLSVYLFAPSSSRYLNTASGGGLMRLFWNVTTYPIESLSQIFIPDGVIFPLSRRVMENIFPYFETTGYAGVVSEKIIVEFISLLAAFFLLPFVIFLFLRKDKFPSIFATLFYAFSFIPYIVFIKSNGYLESRYYYLSVAPVAILFSLFANDFLIFLGKKITKNAIRYGIYLLMTGVFIWYGWVQISAVQAQIAFQIERAQVQKPLLKIILREQPVLSKKQIFYIESDHNFITSSNPLPFQAGIGYLLLVYYAYQTNDSGLTPFLNNDYFWQLGNQGYQSHGDRGFGIFANQDLFKKEVIKQKLGPENIAAFSYDSATNKLVNIKNKVGILLQPKNE